MRSRFAVAVLCLLVPGALGAAGKHDCGSQDLVFGCTEVVRGRDLVAGCGVRAEGKFLASSWRAYDLLSERLLQRAEAPADGIAQLAVPAQRFFVIEGEVRCSDGRAIPFRFLEERLGERRPTGLRTHHYTPEKLVATGNWNPDTQLHFGEFRARYLDQLPRAD